MPENPRVGAHEGRELRSARSRARSFVLLCNYTQRLARPLWLDFQGVPVPYADIPSQRALSINTYVGHPWLFRDATTGDRLLANRRDVFLPELGNIGENGRPQYVPIKITLPVYTLVERCLQVTRQLVPKEDFEQLPIPRSLQQELARVPDLQRELAELRRASAQEDGSEH